MSIKNIAGLFYLQIATDGIYWVLWKLTTYPLNDNLKSVLFSTVYVTKYIGQLIKFFAIKFWGKRKLGE